MISVVCVYNNEETLKKYLAKSLGSQTVEFEFIKTDNTGGVFKSAAEALNAGFQQTTGKYVMFAHQDVDLCSDTWLQDVEKVLDKLPNLGIAGVAGKKNKGGVLTNIMNGNPPRPAGEIHIERPTKVETVDELLVIIPKIVFKKLQFDKDVCNDWHLYSVDYCLCARKLGYDVYLLPMSLYHVSTYIPKPHLQSVLSLGALPDGYYKTLKGVLNKHRGHYRHIYTTSGNWDTAYPLSMQRIKMLAQNGLKLLLGK